ncbi:MAG: hypothetical protein H7833_17075 [Magnetococcus sp. DMHC-1]
MTPMMHRGYAARIEYSDEDECFVGRVADVKPISTFHGESVTEGEAGISGVCRFPSGNL